MHDVVRDAPTIETLAGSRVVVTGSSSGIGQAVAEMFCREGALVAGLDIVDGAHDARCLWQRLHSDHVRSV